jgi:hypothetical protein
MIDFQEERKNKNTLMQMRSEAIMKAWNNEKTYPGGF